MKNVNFCAKKIKWLKRYGKTLLTVLSIVEKIKPYLPGLKGLAMRLISLLPAIIKWLGL